MLVVMVVGVGVVRMLMSVSKMMVVVVVVVRMLVHGHRPGVRLKITSRVVVEPDEAITGNINIRHGLTLCTEELRRWWLNKKGRSTNETQLRVQFIHKK